MKTIDVGQIELFIKLGFIAAEGIQKIIARRRAREIDVVDDDGHELTDAELEEKKVKWNAAADVASAHASTRIEDRHKDDLPAGPV